MNIKERLREVEQLKINISYNNCEKSRKKLEELNRIIDCLEDEEMKKLLN